jgi:hypothetical protein
MEQEAREAYNEYMREWKKKHKEKVKIYNANYWKKKAEKNKSSSN